MSDSVEFSIIGIDSLLAKFESITYDMKRKGGRSALRKASMIVVNALKQNAARIDDPKTARAIHDNAALRWNGRLFKTTGDLGFRVGILKGALLKNGGDKSANAATPHWRLLEFGTSKMAAKPFFRTAIENNINEITNTFVTEYEKAVDRAIKRAAKGK